MSASCSFIKATEKFNTFEENVPSYYFRKAFSLDSSAALRVTVAACGFYELFFNGERITKGFLSPYVSHPDHYVYYDEYELTASDGENVIGFQLGNGFQNNPGGYIWGFDKAPFRSAPMASVSVELIEGGSSRLLFESDSSFKIAPSPIRSDDYRFGEHYDATFEIDGWCERGFDDSSWDNALTAVAPKGELRLADVEPIVKECELKAVSITPCKGGYVYDFGMSNSGVCRLKIEGKRGQKISLRHAESLLEDGDVNVRGICPMKCDWEIDGKLNHLDTFSDWLAIWRKDAEHVSGFVADYEFAARRDLPTCILVPDDIAHYKKAIELGCKMFTSDDPEKALEILKELGVK